MLTKEICGEILAPIIMRRERDEISEGDFHHLIRSVLKVTDPDNQHDLVIRAVKMINMDLTVPPHQRPIGAPGSSPTPVAEWQPG